MTIAPRCTLPPTGDAAEAARRQRALVPVIETGRLRLRAPRPEDIGDWTHVFLADFAADGDGDEQAWTEFSCYASGWLLHGHGLWTVERKSDGLLVGFVLLGLEWSDREPELGYAFLRAHRRQGYASEACAAARDFGFTLLDTFVSYVEPGNAASNRLAEGLGARRDAEAEARLGAEDEDLVHVWRYRRAA
ncbi:GNAT family N-acetyltransferase [Roseibacterium sp. SDUM158017]|uniref:GNAT family N-acetyltransferase n=1 Tax=Roseicyclus salinarum TaxID=3036773 RepID=UPI00241511D8|nr:GNAT family N-acetyltransferase [Roseibacterium sp. SDUM158017]MDG4649508.1 GNAT family N-acetyltransferase [Roseibacterium sp. SDUM158017]